MLVEGTEKNKRREKEEQRDYNIEEREIYRGEGHKWDGTGMEGEREGKRREREVVCSLPLVGGRGQWEGSRHRERKVLPLPFVTDEG